VLEAAVCLSIVYAPCGDKLRSSKFDPRRRHLGLYARSGVALRKRIIAGSLFVAVVIFLALVIGGAFRQ
jgi:hypothetical protein